MPWLCRIFVVTLVVCAWSYRHPSSVVGRPSTKSSALFIIIVIRLRIGFIVVIFVSVVIIVDALVRILLVNDNRWDFTMGKNVGSLRKIQGMQSHERGCLLELWLTSLVQLIRTCWDIKLTAHRVSWPEEDSSNGMVTLLVNSVAIWTRWATFVSP